MPFPISLHTDPRMAAYGFSRGAAPGGRHYLGADRFSAFLKEFLARGLDSKMDMIPASPRATLRELTLFHDPEYLAHVRTRCMDGRGAFDEGATRAERGVDIAAGAVVGTVLHGAKRIVAGDTRRSFIPIAGFPYATRAAALGGAIYNDVAILIIYLKHALPRPRIAYVDLDAHFCGPVYEMFKEDPFVAIADIHQDATSFWTALTGTQEYGREQTQTAWSEVLPAGAGDDAFMAIWPNMLGWLGSFRPDLIIFNAGATGLRGDDIGGLTYSSAVHKRAALDLMCKADATAQGRMIVLGGGGHSPWNAADLWCDVLHTMVEGEALEETVTQGGEDEVLRALRMENFDTPPLPAQDEPVDEMQANDEAEPGSAPEGDGEFEDDDLPPVDEIDAPPPRTPEMMS